METRYLPGCCQTYWCAKVSAWWMSGGMHSCHHFGNSWHGFQTSLRLSVRETNNIFPLSVRRWARTLVFPVEPAVEGKEMWGPAWHYGHCSLCQKIQSMDFPVRETSTDRLWKCYLYMIFHRTGLEEMYRYIGDTKVSIYLPPDLGMHDWVGWHEWGYCSLVFTVQLQNNI